MAAAIASPSSSAIAESPLSLAGPTPKLSLKVTSKRRSATTKGHKKSKLKESPVDKPKQTKSCKNCKEKRLKCDEGKPTCKQCEKKGVSCKGYQKDLKWRPQEDSFKNLMASSRPRKSSTLSKRSRPHPSSHSSSRSSASTMCNGFAQSNPNDSTQQSTIPVDPRISQGLKQFVTQDITLEQSSQPLDLYSSQNPMRKTECGFPRTSPSLANDSFDDEIIMQSSRTAPSSLWSGPSPCLAERLLPGVDLYRGSSDVMDYHAVEPISAYQNHGLPIHQASSSYMEEDVEEIVRESATTGTWMVPLSSPTRSDSSSSSGGSWSESFPEIFVNNPIYHPYSQEMLLMRFDAETCGILSIKNGPKENPWKMMLWPLATTEPALHHAISAMTAFHASKDDKNLRNVGVQHMTHSVQRLSHGLGTMRIHTALSTTLALAFCESWDLLISTGVQHLRGAKKLIWQLLETPSLGNMSREDVECMGFLIRTWVYMDVIARLTSLDYDNSEDFDILSHPICQSAVGGHGLDPLMGCASTMFPIIGRVGNLIRKVRNTRKNSYKFIEEANILKLKLEKWRAPKMFEEPRDKPTDVEQALWTAQAYRSATLLYLHQAVPEISLESVTDKIAGFAKDVLTNLANVPVTSGAVIIHIFPLLAAGCEAADQEARVFIEDRWLAMMQRMKIGNIDKCLEVVKDVWERRDSHEAQKLRNKAFVPESNMQASDIPTTIMKRKIDAGEDVCDPDAHITSTGACRTLQISSDIAKPRRTRRECPLSEGKLEFDLTVRGRRHWAGVMKDKNWEVFVG